MSARYQTTRASLKRWAILEAPFYDMNGRRVNSLINQIQEAGTHSITWNAKDFRGNAISAGVYLYKLEADGRVFTEKMVYMK